MAGSYIHVTDEDGRLLNPRHMADMLENGGDVYEAVEEMYGMIWYLARSVAVLSAPSYAGAPTPDLAPIVEKARRLHVEGLNASPGAED